MLEDYFEDQKRKREKEEKKQKGNKSEIDPKDRGRGSTLLQFNKVTMCLVAFMIMMLFLSYTVLKSMGYQLPFSNTELLSILNKPMDPNNRMPRS